MTRILIAALFVLAFAFPAFACVQSVSSDSSQVQVCVGGACRTILYTNLAPGSNALKAAAVQKSMQAFLDTRLLITTFPPEDPAKAEDPAATFGERFFWSDLDGVPTEGNPLTTTHVTARECIVENVTWDGTAFVLTIRRAE